MLHGSCRFGPLESRLFEGPDHVLIAEFAAHQQRIETSLEAVETDALLQGD